MTITAIWKPSLIISIDLHFNNACIVAYDTETRSVIRKRKVQHRRGGSILQHKIKLALDKVGEPGTVIVESGPSTRALIEYLRDNGFDARMVDARTAARFRQGKHADDWTDAETVARAYSAGLIQDLFFPDRDFHGLRKLNRTRLDTRRDITKLMVKYQNYLLELTGIRFGMVTLMTMKNKKLESILGNSHGLRTAMELRNQIRSLVRKEIDLRKCVNRGLNQYSMFHLLKTIPGVGNALAATILLETGDIGYFRGTSAYASHCGLAGGVSISNGRVKSINAPQGDSRLKWAFSMAARNAFRDRSTSGLTANAFLEKKLLADKSELDAYQSLALRLCKSAFQMMKSQQRFNPELCFGFEVSPQTTP